MMGEGMGLMVRCTLEVIGSESQVIVRCTPLRLRQWGPGVYSESCTIIRAVDSTRRDSGARGDWGW